MAGYAYVARVVGENCCYEITGDVYNVETEHQAVRWMLKDLAEKENESVSNFEVLAFSSIRH